MRKPWLEAGVVLAAFCLTVLPGAAAAQDKPVKRQRDLITRDELLAGQADRDLYAAIRSLRPHFLQRARGTRSMNVERGGFGADGMKAGADQAPLPILYIDGNKSGDLEFLKTILAVDVYEVRYLDPGKAQDQFGLDHAGGAVLVQLVKGIKKPPA